MSMPQGGQTKRRDNQKNRIYANPLPLVIERSTKPHSWSSHTLGLLGLASGRISNPNCEGVLDVTTRSVWIINKRDTLVLWQRGFFGKGNLSRSEPSWLTRRVAQLKGPGKASASELVTAKRREERKNFKAARAAYLKEATAEAEAAFAANSSADIVIPTIGSASQAVRSAAKESKSTPSAPQQHEIAPLPIAVEESVGDEVVAPEDMEHLQLTLQEAFFLANYLACLRILDPQNGQYIPSRSLLFTFLSISASPFPNLPTETPRSDNPFLFNYIVYHHYRSLGWVVRGGIKFCVDYMLYKRGPVFSHAEFALVVIPVYENPADKDTSPFQLQNTDPFSWSWLSTLNRINTQVKKTLILAYVTIPPVETTSPDILRGPECFQLYSTREVVIRRFVPARMRD
ncbi:tRNA intron endonuclease, catalytic C-terminal domain [Rhizoctonia solani]|uniref:tRNA-splicing endonuclease subunit Sen2 n=1 Tax=Rhizoctonia solani TaxID=456999 RepID=A0A8H8SSZ3_9AGAM|nr:tRNA intron endonuclease, catalytic C-terminal domain [Rhizoctonia solani]QRW17064.1 tRNA intron endonuclease, catalytic C-terminal domain [Rhizoctonia solani]